MNPDPRKSPRSRPAEPGPAEPIDPPADHLETRWASFPFTIHALRHTSVPDVDFLTDDECSQAFERRFHDGVTVHVHARYDHCPVLRAFCRVGLGPDGRPYWLVERTDGAKVAARYPRSHAQECFDHFLAVLSSFQAAVNSSPSSPSFCRLDPEDFTIAARLKKIHPAFDCDLLGLGLEPDA